jgi:hypothetical protein
LEKGPREPATTGLWREERGVNRTAVGSRSVQAIGSDRRPGTSGSGAGVAHLPHPEPQPGFDAPNHVFHAARRM